MHYGKDKYIGYRGLDTTNCPVAYPFGHGLSYTNFAYSSLDLAICPVAKSTGQDTPVLTVTFTVSNTGDRAGAAVPQVYLGFPDATIDRCVRELKAFRRVELKPGQRQTVTVALTRRDLSYWDILLHSWTVEPGTVRVEVGASSRDLPLVADIALDAPQVHYPLHRDSTVAEWMANDENFAAKVRHATRKIGIDLDSDPTVAAFVLKPAYKMLQMAPIMTPEELDEILGE